MLVQGHYAKNKRIHLTFLYLYFSSSVSLFFFPDSLGAGVNFCWGKSLKMLARQARAKKKTLPKTLTLTRRRGICMQCTVSSFFCQWVPRLPFELFSKFSKMRRIKFIYPFCFFSCHGFVLLSQNETVQISNDRNRNNRRALILVLFFVRELFLVFFKRVRRVLV